MGFKERLTIAMENKNMSAADLARATGVNEGAISQYRKGAYKASQRNLEKLAVALGVSIPWLMGAEGPDDPALSASENLAEEQELLEYYRNREDMRMLFRLAKGATAEDIKTAAAIIEALKKKDE